MRKFLLHWSMRVPYPSRYGFKVEEMGGLAVRTPQSASIPFLLKDNMTLFLDEHECDVLTWPTRFVEVRPNNGFQHLYILTRR